jgi:hypothetical protein
VTLNARTDGDAPQHWRYLRPQYRPPEAGAEVRILLGAHLPISRVGAARGRSRRRDRPLVRPGPASSPRRTRAVRRTREHTRRGPRRVSGSRRVVLGPTGGAGLGTTVANAAARGHAGGYWKTPVDSDQTDPSRASKGSAASPGSPAARRPRLGAWQTTTTPPPSATS